MNFNTFRLFTDENNLNYSVDNNEYINIFSSISDCIGEGTGDTEKTDLIINNLKKMNTLFSNKILPDKEQIEKLNVINILLDIVFNEGNKRLSSMSLYILIVLLEHFKHDIIAKLDYNIVKSIIYNISLVDFTNENHVVFLYYLLCFVYATIFNNYEMKRIFFSNNIVEQFLDFSKKMYNISGDDLYENRKYDIVVKVIDILKEFIEIEESTPYSLGYCMYMLGSENLLIVGESSRLLLDLININQEAVVQELVSCENFIRIVDAIFDRYEINCIYLVSELFTIESTYFSEAKEVLNEILPFNKLVTLFFNSAECNQSIDIINSILILIGNKLCSCDNLDDDDDINAVIRVWTHCRDYLSNKLYVQSCCLMLYLIETIDSKTFTKYFKSSVICELFDTLKDAPNETITLAVTVIENLLVSYGDVCDIGNEGLACIRELLEHSVELDISISAKSTEILKQFFNY